MITRKEAIEKLKETGMKVPSKMKGSRFKRVVDLIMLLTEKAHEEGYESGENCVMKPDMIVVIVKVEKMTMI